MDMEKSHNNLVGNKKTVTIIGGGIGGLYSALKLCQAGFAITLLERQNAVGGLSTSLSVNDYKIDIGPHYMTFKRESAITQEIFDMVGFENVLEINDIEKSYLSYYNKKLLKTVPTVSDAILSSGSKAALISAFSLIFKSKLKSDTNEMSSEEYLKACFGNAEIIEQLKLNSYFE